MQLPEPLRQLLESSDAYLTPEEQSGFHAQLKEAAMRRTKDVAQVEAIRATFASPNGKRTLKWLRDLAQLGAEPDIEEILATRPEDRPVMQGYRAGLRDVVFLIDAAMDQAKQLNAEGQSDDN